MEFTNYLTSYKAHLLRHIKKTYDFTDTTGLTPKEIKIFVERLIGGSAVPIPSATFEWLSNYFKFVNDKQQLLVYDNTKGTWAYELDDTKMINMLVDYFSAIVSEAGKAKDGIMSSYGKYFFGMTRIPALARRIRTSVMFDIGKSADVVKNTEKYRYFTTTAGTRSLIDMSQPKFNMKTVSFKDTQPLCLMHLSPIPISVTDDLPTLFLSLIDTYMMHDPVLIEYFHKVLAYMMSPYNYNQVFIYFIGDTGRNGKSTIIKVIQDILGPSAVRMNSDLLNSSPSSSFKKDDALSATEGKSLYIFNEIDERMQASTQNIKDLTEGGRDEFGNKLMTVVRPAYSRNYEVNICGTPIIIANSLINFSDWAMLEPIFKRLVLVPFDYSIKAEDPTIMNRLAQEYPKIQAWLYLNYFKYKGIQLKEEKKPACVEKRFIGFKADSDIISMFWNESVEITNNPKDTILKGDIYRMYVVYCQANGRKAIRNKGSNGFQNMIKKHTGSVTISVRQGLTYVVGVKKTAAFLQDINVGK